MNCNAPSFSESVGEIMQATAQTDREVSSDTMGFSTRVSTKRGSGVATMSAVE